MRNRYNPTVLHYAVSEVGSNWVLSCENIPIACFDSAVAARRSADTHVAYAKIRGDCALLEIEGAAAA